VCKDARVRSVDLCEIDERVCEVSKKYLPSMAVGLTMDRVRLVHEDGAKFLADTPPETYDVIIADTSDPEGLFPLHFFSFSKSHFFSNMYFGFE
jgi:spermidine synthase